MGHNLISSMIIIVMGVSGSGKTTIGTLLSETLNFRFAEGEDLIYLNVLSAQLLVSHKIAGCV